MTDYATAIHEAGHAVIGRIVGLPCGPVDIIETEQDYGGACVEPIRMWPNLKKARRCILNAHCLTLFAGYEAEIVVLGCATEGHWHDDLCVLKLCASSELNLPARRIHQRHMRRLTRRLVRTHRSAIEAVANQLIERSSLTRDEVDAIVWPDASRGEVLITTPPTSR